MGRFYTVIENQKSGETFGLIYYHFTDLDAAMAKFFTICAAAAVSSLEYHSAHLLENTGNMIRQEIFDRRTIEEVGE